MSHVASLRVLIIAALATSLSALTLSLLNSGAARAEDTCLTAPKSGAPAGSHWRYRLERGTQRKCWHLVTQGRQVEAQKTEGQKVEGAKETQKGRNAALRAEPPQAEPQPQPQAQLQAEKLTQTQPQPGPAPINDAVQRFTQPLARPDAQPQPPQGFGNAFPPVPPAQDAPPVQAADPAASSNVAANPPATPAEAPLRVNAGATSDTRILATPAEPSGQVQPPAPVAISKRKAASADPDAMRMLPFAIGALAASLVAAGFIFASARRRQGDAIVRIVDLNAKAPPRRAEREIASPSLAMREPWQDSSQDNSADSWQDEKSEDRAALERQRPTRRRAAA